MKKKYLVGSTLFGLVMAAAGSVYATTVEVDGVGGSPNKYASLKPALDALRVDGNTPHVINITVNALSESDQLLIDFPVTINGDGDNDSTPVTISINTDIIKGQTNIGPAGFNFIEIQTAGTVTINNINGHTIKNGTTTTCGAMSFFKPASGTGDYVITNVMFTGSSSAEALVTLDSMARRYYHSGNPSATLTRLWYGYLEGSGIYTATNLGGSGSYNLTLNDCQAGMCRSNALVISNQSGFVHVNGGLYGHSGEDAIRVIGSQDVEIKGTAENRVKLIKTNMSSSGNGLRVKGGGVVKKLEFVDIVGTEPNGTAANSRSGICLESGTINEISFARIAEIGSGSIMASPATSIGGEAITIPVANATVGTINIKNSTFAASEKPAALTAATAINPINIANGTVNFTDCIFSSYNLGTLLINGGTVNFTNCAVPTDAVAKESLSSPAFGGTSSPASNLSPILTSPGYEKQTLDPALQADLGFLAAQNAGYATASSTNGPLTGGAGPYKANVTDWVIY